MNSFGCDFPLEVDTFHMEKLDSLTTRLVVKSFLNWDKMVSFIALSSLLLLLEFFTSPLAELGA